MSMTPKKPPVSGHGKMPPKQTSHPSGGFQAPSGGGAAHPVDGSQDSGTKSPKSVSPKSPKVGPTPSAKTTPDYTLPPGMPKKSK